MSRAVPHYVRVVAAPGQPARNFEKPSKREALDFAAVYFRHSWAGIVVSVFRGKPGDNVDRDPVKVWS